MFPARLVSYLDKRQAERKKTEVLFLQHILYPPFPSKIQPTKNTWACHNRNENLFGLQPVFVSLYGSAFTKNSDLRGGKAQKSSRYNLYHGEFIKLLHTHVRCSEIKGREKRGPTVTPRALVTRVKERI